MTNLVSWEGFTVGHGDNAALVVELPYRFQLGGTCWVFGLGRHLNGMCRIGGLFFRRTVCFDSFYLGVESSVELLPTGGIPDVALARGFLVNHGVPLESTIPLQVQLRPMISVRDMIVHRRHEYTAYENFEDHLLALLVNSPIAVLVPSFASLFGPPHPDGLHYPTVAERTQIPTIYHLMLATGRGTIDGPLRFLQFQDSMEGNHGRMVNLPLGQELIILFVEFVSPYDRAAADVIMEDMEEYNYSSEEEVD